MDTVIKTTIDNLKSRNINGYFVGTIEEAKNKAILLIDVSKEVAVGGSITLNDVGILEELQNPKYNYIDRAITGRNFSMKHWVMKRSATSGTYLSGTNAITKDGMIVNVDGWGNRVNAIQYGPDKVIIVVGKNKIVNDLEVARKRIADIAAPPNTKRLNKKTPCATTGKCSDCRSPERICNILSVIQFQNNPDRMHVIIVDENLGY